MGWDGAGGYNRQRNFSADASAGIKILASAMDQEIDDIASAFTNVLTRDGQNSPTANMALGGQRFINVGGASADNEFLRVREFIENVPIFLQDESSAAGTISASTNYFTSVSAGGAPADGVAILVRVGSDKSSAALYLDGYSANINYQDGTRIDNVLTSGGIYEFIYSSANSAWNVTNPSIPHDDIVYVLSTAESAAGVTPVNYHIRHGWLPRYGNNTTPGTTDTASAVANWIQVGMQGQALYHPGDNWLCSAWTQIEVSADLRIFSDNRGRLTGTTSVDFLQPAGGDIMIDGLHFDGWNNVLENDEADSGTTDQLDVRNCEFSNIALYAIDHRRPLTFCRIVDNHFRTIGTGCLLLGFNTAGNQDTWEHLIVSRNTAEDINNTGAGNVHFALAYGRYVEISNNIIENMTSDTGEAWGIFTKARYHNVSNNIISGVASSASNAIAINIKGDIRAETSTVQGFAGVISNNTLLGSGVNTGNPSVGIQLECEDLVCSDNFIENFEQGVRHGGGDGVSITGNRIICTDSTVDIFGINLNGAGSNTTVTGNNIETCGEGIRVANVSAENTYLISDNVIEDCDNYAIELDNSATLTGVLVANNQVRNCAQFIFLDNVSDYVIRGNQFLGLTGTMTQWFNWEGTTNGKGVIEGNEGLETQTTGASTTTMFQIDVPNSTAWHVESTLIGIETDNTDRAIYKRNALVYGTGGNATIQGSATPTGYPIESDAGWDGLQYAESGAFLQIQTVGSAGNTINWSLDVTIHSID